MTNEQTMEIYRHISKSTDRTFAQIKDGLPEGIDAVRVDITYHAAGRWHSTITGTIATLNEGMKFDLSGDEVKE